MNERLSQLKIGEKGKVVRMDYNDKQRLYDLGIIEETEIEVMYKSPFGNPTAYLIRGTVFALRDDTADMIVVEKI